MTLKKVSAIFVSAALAMAMLVGCGAGSVGDQLRDKTEAGAKAEVNKVAIELAEDGLDSQSDLVDAVKNVAGTNAVSGDVDYPADKGGQSVYKADVETTSGKQVGIYYAFTVSSADEDEVVAKAAAAFDAIQFELDNYKEGIEYYIGASAIDEDAGSYVIVIYADFANVEQ